MAVIGEHTVYLRDDDGTVHSFLPGQRVPAWAAKQMGPHCFAKDQPDEEVADFSRGGGEGPPPRAGAGSGRGAWADYAAAHGIDVDEDWKRDQIIDACEDKGIAVE
ncbi:hypothetical protein DSM43518_04778 [Mycobacterium marinum]|uniref:Uncharacterized protein n=1 Tax=Mycobacterium marinum TaxID=1781 RepID=A0A2Z5YJ85_MYCMR|nr:hypothetical protein [Mycobacterium marinum]AXN51236.1 hypothetical protein CCUG20998_03840 [Mycobacterium marinum]RFZ02791.1 hypothetical protein DSM43518_04778 [Mycobacterium marinum]RFZ25982.1 hypothetical protein DSM43519_01296 [Mycobacterium marinum]RFZ28861.1 hypothetical protein DSM44344_01128 [Mycobacterium marinum]RFZ39047.1 hypothetical protein NCTC2275_00315 [Mycobacterium marinum]